jgi:hypothetical protein
VRQQAQRDRTTVYGWRPIDVRGELKVLKLRILEASHPRIAGIVQVHRQQIDAAAHGQQQVSEKDI